MLGMSAAGIAAKPASCFCRRVHSPPAMRAAASKAPKNNRKPGPIRPASMEYLTRKMPPSASATPPIQTVQRVPNFSSKLMTRGGSASTSGGAGGAGSAAGGGVGGGFGTERAALQQQQAGAAPAPVAPMAFEPLPPGPRRERRPPAIQA